MGGGGGEARLPDNGRLAGLSVAQSAGHPGIRSVSRLVCVSVGRVVGHLVGHSVSRSIGESVSRVVGHSVGPVDLYPLVSGW